MQYFFSYCFKDVHFKTLFLGFLSVWMLGEKHTSLTAHISASVLGISLFKWLLCLMCYSCSFTYFSGPRQHFLMAERITHICNLYVLVCLFLSSHWTTQSMEKMAIKYIKNGNVRAYNTNSKTVLDPPSASICNGAFPNFQATLHGS